MSAAAILAGAQLVAPLLPPAIDMIERIVSAIHGEPEKRAALEQVASLAVRLGAIELPSQVAGGVFDRAVAERTEAAGAPVITHALPDSREVPRASLSPGLKTDRATLDTTIDPATGKQAEYLVLSAEERARGFVRPVRESYVHTKCGTVTRMARGLAETYAREPGFYSGTFCASCRNHFPVGAGGEFVWDGSTEKVGT